MTLGTLNHGMYGIFLLMSDAGFRPSTVVIMLLVIVRTVTLRWGLHGQNRAHRHQEVAGASLSQAVQVHDPREPNTN